MPMNTAVGDDLRYLNQLQLLDAAAERHIHRRKFPDATVPHIPKKQMASLAIEGTIQTLGRRLRSFMERSPQWNESLTEHSRG